MKLDEVYLNSNQTRRKSKLMPTREKNGATPSIFNNVNYVSFFFLLLAIFLREKYNKQNACRAFSREYKLRMSCRNADAAGSCRKPRSSIFMRTGGASVNYPGTFVQHMFLPDSERTGFLP